jgi:DUF971 family protein
MSEQVPRAINVSRTEGTLSVVWPDGTTTVVPLMKFRQVCPCATCAEARGENPHPGLLETPPPSSKPPARSLPLLGDVRKFQVSSLRHVGRYALGVTWGDNHQSIYSWAFLADLRTSDASTVQNKSGIA